MKDELGGKIMNEFTALKAKTYSYLTHNKDNGKIRYKKVCHKKKI